eukprot:553466_1
MSTLNNTYMFVGCYSRKMGHAAGLGKGISVFNFDTTNGNAKYITTIPESDCGLNPTAFYINNKTNYIYACNEYSTQSSLTGVQFDPDNNFETIQQFTQKSFGQDPCFAISDWGQNFLYVANYGGTDKPSVSIYKIDENSNYLIPFAKHIPTEPGSNAIPSRQALPHMHCIMPCKNLAEPFQFYVNDLGRDSIYHYKMSENGELKVISSLQFVGGDGPRHMSYNPIINGILYISQEMGSSISVVQFNYKTNKLLDIVQRVTTLPSDIINDAGSVYTTSQIMCDKTGRFVYCTNRGHDSIVRYIIDNKTGLLDENIGPAFYKCGGKVPRHFNIDPTNNYLIVANQEGAPFDNISIFKINHNKNGALQFVQCIQSGTPSFIEFIQKPKKK